ncbi:MAG: hypothetical protein WAL67_14380 [Candidatus Cybelea sp.]
MKNCRPVALATFVTLFGVTTALSTAATNSLSATTPASSSDPLSISCTASSAPSETGTANYYLVLKAQYQNHGSQTIAPIIIRFDFRDQSGKVIASHTVIDSTGLAPQYGNNGQWQSVGYPTSAVSLTCNRVSSNRL